MDKIYLLNQLVDEMPCSYGEDLGKFPYVSNVAKVSNISADGLFKKDYEKRSFREKELKKLLVEKDDLLVVKSSGSKANILSGKTAFCTGLEEGQLVASNFLLRLKPKKNLVFSRYLWYILNCQHSKNYVKTIVGATTYPNLKWGLYGKLPILLPTLSKQQRIVTILDYADSIRRNKLLILEKYNQLAQSVFFEIFGDPVSNSLKWKTTKFGSLITNIESGWSPVCKDHPRNRETKWAVLKLGAVTYKVFNPSENKEMLDDILPKSVLEVKHGDLLFTRKNTRELVGACVYVDGTPPNLMIPDTIFRFNYIKSLTNPIFLWFLFNNKNFSRLVQNLSTGSAASMPNISKTKLLDLEMVNPPKGLQDRFAGIISQIDYLKLISQKSLEKSEDLFQSLLQRAFKGEL